MVFLGLKLRTGRFYEVFKALHDSKGERGEARRQEVITPKKETHSLLDCVLKASDFTLMRLLLKYLMCSGAFFFFSLIGN